MLHTIILLLVLIQYDTEGLLLQKFWLCTGLSPTNSNLTQQPPTQYSTNISAYHTFNLLTQTVNSAAASHLKHFTVANVLKAAQFQTRRSSLLDKELQAAHLHLLSEVTSSFRRGTAVCRGQLLPGFFIKMTKTAAAGVL